MGYVEVVAVTGVALGWTWILMGALGICQSLRGRGQETDWSASSCWHLFLPGFILWGSLRLGYEILLDAWALIQVYLEILPQWLLEGGV